MFVFKKKYPRIEDSENVEPEPEKEEPQQVQIQGSAALTADIMKLKAQFDQFSELRKVINERFTRINEQVGELRGMIMDGNRTMQDIEVKSVKAVDLVEAVHPDKLMVDVRKQDAKIESLKANIESNDSIMKTIMDQLKEMRHQLNAFRGIEQVVKLNEEVKKQLMNIKQVQANVERHSDKIEAIFIESQKRFQEFETLGDRLLEVQKSVSSAIEQSNQNKVKITSQASRKEVEDLVSKVSNFEKHVGNVIDLLTKRANDLPKEIDDRFKKLEKNINDMFAHKIKRAEQINKIIDKIEKEAPRIAKELQIAEKLKDVKVEKSETVQSPEITESVKKIDKEKKGFFAKLMSKPKEKSN